MGTYMFIFKVMLTKALELRRQKQE